MEPAGASDQAAYADAQIGQELFQHEWLATIVLQHVTDVRTVCTLALVNRTFFLASLSNSVWRKRLPPQPVLDAVGAPHLCKRDLYIHLCRSVFYEEGQKKFWLDTASGGECHMISARSLRIAWKNDPRYWEWGPLAGSMFPEVAKLLRVSWFDIAGTFQQSLRPGKYMLSYRVQCLSPGWWRGSPVKLCVENSTHAHSQIKSQVFFDDVSIFKRRFCPASCAASMSQTPVQSDDVRSFEATKSPCSDSCSSSVSEDKDFEANDEPSGSSKWVEIDAGEFFVEDDNEGRAVQVHFSMRETEVLGCKAEFVLDGVIIRPIDVANDIIKE